MSEVRSTQEIEPPLQLSRQDLINIITHNLGLRHDTVSAQTLTFYKQPKDALALASLINLLPQNVLITLPNYSNPVWQTFYKGSPETVIGLLTSSQVELLSSKFINRISLFVTNWMKDPRATHFFSLLTGMNGSKRGYDCESYYDLGKCGLQSITPDQLLAQNTDSDSRVVVSSLISQIKNISQTRPDLSSP